MGDPWGLPSGLSTHFITPVSWFLCCHLWLQAQRTKACLPLLRDARRAILLSGTPALSKPIELMTQLQVWPIHALGIMVGHLSTI